jgi:hypothetical protein
LIAEFALDFSDPDGGDCGAAFDLPNTFTFPQPAVYCDFSGSSVHVEPL